MARYFLRLKLALLTSSLRRGWRHGLGLVAGALVGLPFALAVAAGLGLAARTDVGPPLLVLTYAVAAVGWTLAPMLLFGLDETLDPARLRLLPLSRRQLLTGLSVAAAVGVGPIATVVVLASGLAYARGVLGLVVVAAAVAAHMLVCLWSGRALATALSATLRSRKGRDLAAVAGALAGLAFAGVAQLPSLLEGVVDGPEELLALVEQVAGVVAWTPPGWAAGAIVAVHEGRPATALLLLAATVALAAVLAWGWQAALERALATPDAAAANGRDAPLVPAWLPLRPGPLAGAVSRELRYLVRVPQLRVSYGMLGAVAVGIVVAPLVVDVLDHPLATYAPALAGGFQAMQAVNGFGHDRGAVWLLVATGSDHRTDLAGKALGQLLGTMAVVVPATLAVTVVVGGWAHLLPALCFALALQGAALGVGSVTSVLAPYPMPDGANVWGGASGMGCATAFVQVGALAAQGLLLAPAAAAVVAVYLLAPGALPLAGLLAVAYGLAVAVGGVLLAAARLDARGPEFVAALSADR